MAKVVKKKPVDVAYQMVVAYARWGEVNEGAESVTLTKVQCQVRTAPARPLGARSCDREGYQQPSTCGRHRRLPPVTIHSLP